LNLPLGIRESPELGMHVCYCAFNNAWREILNNEYVNAYAGGYREPSDLGLLMVYTMSRDGLRSSGFFQYATPSRVGWVRIESVNGTLLTLLAQNGQQFVFDVQTRTWVSP
jgi:hypothetical protein